MGHPLCANIYCIAEYKMKHASIALLLLAFLFALDAHAGAPTRGGDLPDEAIVPEALPDGTDNSIARHRATRTGSLKNRALDNSPVRNRLKRHAVQNLKATVVAARKSLPHTAYQKIESQLRGVTKKYAAKPGFNTLNTKQLAAQDGKVDNKNQRKQTKTTATSTVLLGHYEPGCCCSPGNDARFVTDAALCGSAEQFTQTCAPDPSSNTLAQDCRATCCATISPPNHGLVAQLLQLADADMKK